MPTTTSKPRPARRPSFPAPVHLRAIGVPLSDDDRTYALRRIAFKLGKHGRSIERVSVRIEDVNGPRGGVDKRCRIKVVVRGRESVVTEQPDQDLRAAVDVAADRVERSVRRSLEAERRRALRGGRTVRGGRTGKGVARRK
jgi:putative sigma-54 modulation protein